jgi:hypothetical protein
MKPYNRGLTKGSLEKEEYLKILKERYFQITGVEK